MFGPILQLPPRLGAAAGGAARWLLVVLLLVWFSAPPARAAVPTPSAWPVNSGVPVESLPSGPEAQSLIGRTGHAVGAADAPDILAWRSREGGRRFTVPQSPIRTEASAPPQWFKVRLQQPEGADSGAWVLTLGAQTLHTVHCFGPYPDAAHLRSARSAEVGADGTPTPAPTLRCTPVASDQTAFLIVPPAPGTYDLYLRTTAGLPQTHALSVQQFAEFDRLRQATRLFDGASYGLVLGLMLFALILFWTFRERIYLAYLGDLAAAFATLALFNGHVSQYLLPASPAWVDRLLVATVGFWGAFALQRAHRYLGMREHVPRIGRIVRALVTVGWLATIATLAGALRMPSLVIAGSVAAGLMLLPWCLRPSPKFGYRFNAWYLITSGWICIVVLLKLADLWGLLPLWWSNYKVFQATVLALCLIFTAIYGDRLSRVWLKQDQLRKRTQELAQAAETDPLTGLANRAGLERHAQRILLQRPAWALLLIDLDCFKPINDSFGHAVGDAVLADIGARLRRASGPQDVAVRLGGDEFALVLADRDRHRELAQFAAQLIESIGAPIKHQGRVHQVGASVGIARCPDDGRDLSGLLRCADLALYQAKRDGRGGFTFFDDLTLQPPASIPVPP